MPKTTQLSLNTDEGENLLWCWGLHARQPRLDRLWGQFDGWAAQRRAARGAPHCPTSLRDSEGRFSATRSQSPSNPCARAPRLQEDWTCLLAELNLFAPPHKLTLDCTLFYTSSSGGFFNVAARKEMVDNKDWPRRYQIFKVVHEWNNWFFARKWEIYSVNKCTSLLKSGHKVKN